jgi:hypothetical protein
MIEWNHVMPTHLDWDTYARSGYLDLGPMLEPEQVAALCDRADALALGDVTNPAVQVQLDTGGAYEELAPIVDRFEDGTLGYRKIQGLESDDLFGDLVRHPTFVDVCARQYGPHVPVSIFRAMVMNKPAGQGTRLPWHQDGGAVWALDRDPLVTIWLALDAATAENGCLEIVPGSHLLGLLSWYGSTVTDDVVAEHCGSDKVMELPVEAGHAVLMHNWLLHRSGVNPSPSPRRAFTCCYMDGRTRNQLTGDTFPPIWGTVPDDPPVFLAHLRHENGVLRESHASAEEYALSLVEENRTLHAAIEDATTYAHSLEAELTRAGEKRG